MNIFRLIIKAIGKYLPFKSKDRAPVANRREFVAQSRGGKNGKMGGVRFSGSSSDGDLFQCCGFNAKHIKPLISSIYQAYQVNKIHVRHGLINGKSCLLIHGYQNRVMVVTVVITKSQSSVIGGTERYKQKAALLEKEIKRHI